MWTLVAILLVGVLLCWFVDLVQIPAPANRITKIVIVVVALIFAASAAGFLPHRF
jgi:hypothetical protein